MNNEALRVLLDLWMCSDPWPCTSDPEPLISFIEQEVTNRGYEKGYSGIIEAYHTFEP
jgi:hypothetical protein